MKRNVLNKYLNDQIYSIEKELNNFRKHREHESLHALRVGIKKIKAVLSFAENMYDRSYPRKELNLLFHKTGTIRELHVILDLMKSLHLSTALSNPLAHKMARLEENFLEKMPRYFEKLNAFFDKTDLPAKMPHKKAVLRYFKKRRKELSSELQSKTRNGLHCYRRDIKRMMYVYGILPEKWQTEIGLDKAKTDRLQEKIGRWHDTWSAVTFLSRQRFSTGVKETLEKLKEKEKRQFKTLVNR